MQTKLLAILVFFLIIGNLFAQIPSTLSYQGILTDSNGSVVPDGNYNLTFRLYTTPNGDTPIWQEGQLVLVRSGVFTAVLGSIVPLEIPFDQAYWLGISVGAGEELTPRIQLTASPYSLNSRSVADSSISSKKIASGTVVRSINGLSDQVNLMAGENISISATESTLTISATGGNEGGISEIVAGNGLTGGGSGSQVRIDAGVGTGLQVSANAISLDTGMVDARYVNEGQENAITGAMILAGAVGNSALAANSVTVDKVVPDIVSSINHVKNDGGNIDLVAGNNISITADDENDRIVISASEGGGISGSGTVNYIPKFIDSTDLGSSVIYENEEGNIGIGTNSPSQKLEVAGVVKMNGFQMSTASQDGYVLTSDALGNGSWKPVGLTLPYSGSVSSSSTAFSVTNNGGGAAGSFISGESGTTTTFRVENRKLGDWNRGIDVWSPNLANGEHGGVITFGKEEGTGKSGHVSFVPSSTDGEEYLELGIYNKDDLMVINGKGFVGVGTISPDARFHLVDDSYQSYAMKIQKDTKTGEYSIRPHYGINCVVKDGAYNYAIYSEANGSPEDSYGIYTVSQNGYRNFGVYASSSLGSYCYGIYAEANGSGDNYGIYAYAPLPNGDPIETYAGYFNGDVQITGTLSKGAGSFKIDHPLDPENKYLLHSFVESPDMMNIYNGNVILDDNGEAWVQLPDWFEALNKNFRYQLTPVGAPGPDLYIAEEIRNNRFKIAGGKPGMKVSWQVTGIRHDPYANKFRIPVEVDKSTKERGKYLHPEAYDLPESMSINYEKIHRNKSGGVPSQID